MPTSQNSAQNDLPSNYVRLANSGLGSINGQALQDELKTTAAKSAADVMTSR